MSGRLQLALAFVPLSLQQFALLVLAHLLATFLDDASHESSSLVLRFDRAQTDRDSGPQSQANLPRPDANRRGRMA